MKAIGIALGADRLLAVLPRGRQLETRDVSDLRRAFVELKRASGLARARVSVGLMPPLVDLRRVTLPPLRAEERRRVLARDAGRYFMGAREPQVVASECSMAAAAPTRCVEAIEAAVAAVKWTLRDIVPAPVAWAAGVPHGHVVARLPHAVELLRVERGRIVERRILRTDDGLPPAKQVDPYVVAAAGAQRARSLALRSDAGYAALRRSAKRIAVGLAGSAAVCLMLAAAVDYWGLTRELTALRSRRAALAPQVATAMQLRDSAAALNSAATTLEGLASATPRWSSFFADVAEYLPHDAHLATLQARGDSVLLVGVAHTAIGVVQGLGQMPGLTRLRADGPVRQDVTPTGTVREQFRLSARWAP